MRRMLLVAVTLGIACGPSGLAAQELEHVFVEVLDRAGRPVPDLTPADFALQENDVDLDVVSVRRGPPRPMSIHVTLPSAAARDRVRIREARRAFRVYHAQCFWYLRPDMQVTLGDVPEIVRGLRRNGGRKEFLLAARLCR